MSANYQSGVISPASSDALFITLNVKQGRDQQIIGTLQQIQSVIFRFQERFSAQSVHAVVAIGSDYWNRLTLHVQNASQQRPALLTAFPRIQGVVNMPVTPVDLLLHLRSNRRDITFQLAQELMVLFSDAVDVAEDVSCFRYLDARDLTGFVDGTENPEGDHKKSVAIVGDEDEVFAGGSYIHLQRYVHDLNRWAAQPVKDQEDVYGRTKQDNIEYPSDKKPLTAHTKRASLKDSQGNSIEILRHSMPYAHLMEAGLLFASYCRTPENFTLILKSMVESDGNTDKLMEYTTAVTGQAFFAPPLSWFAQLQ